MEIFNKIGDIASRTYEKTTKKTEEIAKETKIKMKMNSNKSKISDLFQEIGKKVYQNHIQKDELTNSIEEYLSQIDELSKEIENYQEEILTIKNKRICKNCNSEVNNNDNYCSNCGYEQEEREENNNQ